MGKEAENLTHALKGDSKTQGNWGEIQIENKLRKWVTDLETEGAKNTTIKGGLSKNLDSVKSTVTDMSKVIEGLVTENNYLRMLNRDFIKGPDFFRIRNSRTCSNTRRFEISSIPANCS